MKLVAVVIALAVVSIGLFSSFTGLILHDSPAGSVRVERVIDGDTVVLENGEHVRLLGIDTPEKGQHLFEESTAFVRKRVEGKSVRLEKDTSERGKYGRLLRYIFVDGIFLNEELLRKGYASVLLYEPDTKYRERFLRAEGAAKEQQLGIWTFPEGDYCLGIFSFRYNAPGNDNENLNREKVIFRNKCFEPIELGGLVLNDRSRTRYTFPSFVLENKTKVTLHTGSGTDSKTDLYWNQKRAVWNNGGDELTVRNAEGDEMLRYAYGKAV